jgi:hypothetical protein
MIALKLSIFYRHLKKPKDMDLSLNKEKATTSQFPQQLLHDTGFPTFCAAG